MIFLGVGKILGFASEISWDFLTLGLTNENVWEFEISWGFLIAPQKLNRSS